MDCRNLNSRRFGKINKIFWLDNLNHVNHHNCYLMKSAFWQCQNNIMKIRTRHWDGNKTCWWNWDINKQSCVRSSCDLVMRERQVYKICYLNGFEILRSAQIILNVCQTDLNSLLKRRHIEQTILGYLFTLPESFHNCKIKLNYRKAF